MKPKVENHVSRGPLEISENKLGAFFAHYKQVDDVNIAEEQSGYCHRGRLATGDNVP